MPVAIVLSIIFILILLTNIVFHNIPSLPHRSMETARRPKMISAPFLKVGKFFP
jgi:hypothetical protein